MIIINDGDTNDFIGKLIFKLKSYEPDINIKYIQHNDNEGISKSRNEGMSFAQFAQTEWIAFLDADDRIQPTYFEELFNETDGVDIVACSCYAITNETS